MAVMGKFQLDRIIHLRSAPQSKGSKIKQTECDTYFNWYAEPSKRLQDSKIASLKTHYRKLMKN